MKRTIVLNKNLRGKPAGAQLTLPAAQAKVIVEVLKAGTYLDKSLQASPVVKTPPLPGAPSAPVVPSTPAAPTAPVAPAAPVMPTKIPDSFPIVNGKKEGSEKTTLSRKGNRNSSSSNTENGNE